MRAMTASLTVLLAAVTLTHCDKDKKTYDFGAPNVGAIVEASAPKGLTGAGASLTLAADCSSFNPNQQITGGWQLIDNYFSYIKCATFQKNPNVEGPAYYRYWVDVLDKAMAETNKRLNDAADSLPACVTATPTTLTLTFDVESASSTSSETVSFPMKFSCYESQSTPTPGSSQVMAFGKDETHFYLMYITKDAEQLTSTGQGIRIVMAKADASGNEADIWMIGNSYQNGPSVIPTDKISTMVNRVIANKTTGAFTYSIAESVIGLTKQSSFIRSNGSYVYFSGQTALPGNDGLKVTDVVDSTGQINEFCYASNSLESQNIATCTGVGLNTVPSNFGLTEVPRAKAVATFFADLKASVNKISTTDFAALGIQAFTSK